MPSLSLFYTFVILTTVLGLMPSHADAQVTVTNCSLLDEAIVSINAGQSLGEIRVPADTYMYLSECGELTPIRANISIVGVGSSPPTISGDDYSPIFVLENTGYAFNITLKNLVLSNGGAFNGYGGCLLLPSTSHGAFISNVIFRECFGTYGAAIHSAGGPLIIKSSTFHRNKATRAGGAISMESGNNLFTITNSSFISNSVFSTDTNAFGGAISSSSSITIVDSIFNSNSASTSSYYNSYGGAIRMGDSRYNVTITRSRFTSNFATSSKYYAYGGALDAENLILDQTLFTSNKVTGNYYGYGGAIYSTNLTSTANTFFNNSANSKSLSARSNGGAIFCTYCTITSTSFSENKISAPLGAGGALTSIDTLFLTSSTFSKNSIVSTGINAIGGALYTQGSFSSITNSSFYSNSVSASGKVSTPQRVSGGAIHTDIDFNDDKNLYSNNTATFTGINLELYVYGGAIHGTSRLIISSSKFTNNRVVSQASGSGGGALSSSSWIDVSKSTFTGNSALSACRYACNYVDNMGGGAIYESYGSVIQSSYFENNTHTTNASLASGGALSFQSSYNVPHNITNCTFANNTAASSKGPARGGAASVTTYYSTVYFQRCIFLGNLANGVSTRGGAIALNGFTLYVFNSTFNRNMANSSSGNAQGGAIDLSGSDATNSIFSSTFISNQATSKAVGYARGGAVFHGAYNSYNYALLRLYQSSFSNNYANSPVEASGGALFVNDYQSLLSSKTSFSGSVITASTVKGGAIHGGQYARLYFCLGNTFSLTNLKSIPTKTSILSQIETDVGADVRFCPLITAQIDRNATSKPTLSCEHCDCSTYFNPCDSKATCTRISNPTSTVCACPTSLPGNGFICGGSQCTTRK